MNVVTGCINTTNFIEVHIFAPDMEYDGDPIMINLHLVETVNKHGTHAKIHMAYNFPEGNYQYQDTITTTESYEEIKNMIWR